MEKGRPAPSWYEDNPYVPVVFERYIDWFWELSTERQIGMSVGPIPVSKINECADRHGLDKENTRVFESLMQTLDSWYMEWVRESSARLTKRKAPPPPPPDQRGWGSGRKRTKR